MNRFSPVFAITVGLTWLLAGEITLAQAPAGDSPPRWLLNVNGPIGTVRCLDFVPGTNQLIGAGIDKTVKEWFLHQPAATSGHRLVRASTLRWKIMRGSRGGIFGMDLSPNGEMLAIAGLSAQNDNGDIWLFNRITRTLIRVLKGHQTTVKSLSFSPDNNWLASGDMSGELRLWRVPEQVDNDRDRQLHEGSAGPEGAENQPVLFVSPNRILHSHFQLAKQHLMLYDVTRGKLWDREFNNVTTLARGESGNGFAIGFTGGRVRIVQDETFRSFIDLEMSASPESKTDEIPNGLRLLSPEATSMDFGADGLLLLTTYSSGGRLRLWDTQNRRERWQVDLGPAVPYACAISDSGEWVAAYASNPPELRVYRIKDDDGELLDSPEIVIRHSGGEMIENIRFEQVGAAPNEPQAQLVLDLAPDRPRWVFDMQTGDLRRAAAPDEDRTDAHAPPNPGGAPVPAPAPGHQAGPLPKSVESKPDADRKGAAPLSRDRTRPAAPTEKPATLDEDVGDCATVVSHHGCLALDVPILPDRTVRIVIEDPYAKSVEHTLCLPSQNENEHLVAVGTAPDGLYVYRVSDDDMQPELVRYFRDHTGPVRQLATTPDGRWLASHGDDRIVRLWSLAEINHPNLQVTRWGARFEIDDREQGIRVRNVQEGGILANRGFQNGDLITHLDGGPSGVPIRNCDPDAHQVEPTAKDDSPPTVDHMLEMLATDKLWSAFYFTLTRDGQRLPGVIAVVPGWEPAVSIFVERTGEWAVWTPQGYYNASPDGETLFGWLINRERSEEVDFYPAGQFRDQFERPDLIQDALNLLSSDVLQTAPPLRAKGPILLQEIQERIQVKILAPEPGEVINPGQPVQVVAQIDVEPLPVERQNMNPKAFINFVPIDAEPEIDQRNGRITWKTDWPPGYALNKIEVTVDHSDQNRLPAEDTILVKSNNNPGGQRRLHILAIGISKYDPDSKKRESDWNLKNAKNDAEGFLQALERQDGEYYTIEQESLVIQEDSSIRLNADRMREEVDIFTYDSQTWDPERDLMIFYYAGHGAAADGEFYFLTVHEKLSTISVADASRDPNLIRDIGVPWRDLSSLLAAPCRKLFILDTCQSGQVVERGEKLLIRELKQQRAMVFAATVGESGSAFEYANEKHSLFTGQLLLALTGSDSGQPNGSHGQILSDGVTLQNLVEFVDITVTEREPNQDPVFVPQDVFDFYDWNLAPAP